MAKRNQSRSPVGGNVESAPAPDYDSPWKEILDRYFEAFLAFFFPEAHADIDWSRGYEMLDKELQKIVAQAEQGRRVVDKLVKVWLNGGEERWILIHVEVQTSRESNFPRRMYGYNCRIFNRYDREVISLAVLADDDLNWRPNEFGYSRWGFRTSIEFPIVKLMDYAAREHELRTSPNPFAVVVLAHLKARETRQDPASRKVWKVQLVKHLYERGMSAEDVRQLFVFIDWIMQLPEDLDQTFLDEITEYQPEKRMRFITTPERLGIKKGMQMGTQKGLLQGLEVTLKMKFGAAGLALLPELRELEDNDLLASVLQTVHSAISPDDLRRLWTPKRRSKATRRAPGNGTSRE